MMITDKKLKLKFQGQKGNEKDGYWNLLINGIVRPPRANYKESLLGSKNFILNETQYSRVDHQVAHDGKFITLTVYEAANRNDWLILYLHGNSSSRLEAMTIIRFLPFKFSLACFDFMGCGTNKQLDTISLGHRQSQQTETVVRYLQQMGYKIVLWGRSMGAASALKFGKVPIIVADSSYAKFKSLCKQVAKRNSPTYLPNCLISCFFPCVFYKLRQDVSKRGDYDVQVLNIEEAVKQINPMTAIVFMSGDSDNLIDKQNSEKLYKLFIGKRKFLEIFPGNHNTKRPEETLKKVMGIVRSQAEEYDVSSKQSASRTRIDLEIE